MSELEALRLAVQELYGMVLELDEEPAPIEEYVCRAAGVAAREALGPLWPASGFQNLKEAPADPLNDLVLHRKDAQWDAFSVDVEARLTASFTRGGPR